MIYFITKKQHKVVEEENVLLIKSELSQDDKDFLSNADILGFDYEATGLDPYLANPLLLVLGNDINQYVIDCNSINCIETFKLLKSDVIVIGANLKYDYKLAKVKHLHTFTKLFDVMIAEQRITQGMGYFNGNPIKGFYALDTIVERRLKIASQGLKDTVRTEFINVNPVAFQFENKHIHYAAGDIKPLFALRLAQKEIISTHKLEFLIYGIEFPLILELAEAELEGFVIDELKWNTNIIQNEINQFEAQCKLDVELRNLRDNLLPQNERNYLTGGKFDRNRNKAIEIEQLDMFSIANEEVEVNPNGQSKKKTKVQSPYINWGSPQQLVEIFGRLKQPLTTKQGEYIVPKFEYSNKQKKDKLVKGISFTTGKGSIESYLNENPETPIRSLVKLLIEFRKYTTRLNTFGTSFLIKFKNHKTHKFHTIYRQCSAITGRLQSGDKKNNYYNSQNIPRDKEYRECFIAPKGYLLATYDLSGAEAVIMIDKARDEKFYEMAIKTDDAHSPLAMACWRAIGRYRMENGITTCNHGFSPQQLAVINVSKKVNKEIRTLFKNFTFASIYGVHFKKVAKMLNISLEEAKIVLIVTKAMIPKTFKMVESNAKFALANGYIILNYRTNSRIYYPELLKAIAGHYDLDFSTTHQIDGSARNAPIQGTQADIIKETIVEIAKEIKRQKLDAKFVMQVHDELVYKFNKNIILVEFINDKKEVGEVIVEEVSFGEFIRRWMIQVSNRYLSFITMAADGGVGECWNK